MYIPEEKETLLGDAFDEVKRIQGQYADGLITSVTDFWPEPYEPPSGREHLVERW